jgi:serine/threonine protein kinase
MGNWIGQTLGGYQIAEEIGQGGTATVYRAFQPQLERWVALKVLRFADTASEEFLTRFRREARAVAALRHPNILTIYDYGEEKGVAFIVMEYVPGGTLKSLLTGRPLEWPDVATLILPVGMALEYAHSQGIIHRDVKPGNILLARPDWPLLADFGLAKLAGASVRITQPGASLGTPAYLSPEQAAGEPVDHRTDIYALGVMVYELLTGQVPCQCGTPLETMLRRLREPPVPLRVLNPHVSPQLEEVVMRALARNPAERYPSMQALVDALARLPGATGRPLASSTNRLSTTLVAARPADAAALQGPRLLLVTAGISLMLPAKEEVLIGRSDPHQQHPLDIDLEPYGGAPAGVSRRHARLSRQPEGWSLEDLGSTNGTFLNEERLSPHRPVRLRSGDHVRFSTLAFMFLEE